MENSTRTNPLVVIAAVAVTLFSIVGIGTMTGLIPSSLSKTVPTATMEPAAQGNSLSAAGATAAPGATAPAGATAAAGTAAPNGGAAGSPGTPADAAAEASGTAKPEPHRASKKHRDPASATAGTNPPAAVGADKVAANVPAAAPPPPPVCRECGEIDSIRPVVEKGHASGLGAIAGGVLGVVAGHQVGHGDGKTAATILGGAGGAVAGNEIEKNVNKTTHYEVTVAMNDGSSRKVSMKSKPQFVVGERVRIVNGQLQHD